MALRESQRRLKSVIDAALDAIVFMDHEGRITDVNPAAEKVFGFAREDVLGRRLVTTLIPERFRKQHEEAFTRYLRTGVGSVLNQRLELPALRWDGSEFPAELTITATTNEHGQPFFTGYARDLTQQKEAVRILERRAGQQRAVAELGQFAMATVDVQEFLDRCASTVAHVLESEYCKVLELLPDGKRFLLRAGVGWREGLVGTAILGAGLQSQGGYTLQSAEPIIVTDLRRETRFHGPPLLLQHGAISGIGCVIAGSGGKPWGVLSAHSSRCVRFAEDDVHFLLAVANLIGSAVSRQQTEDAVRESEQRLRFTMDAAKVGAWDWDIEAGTVKWSDNLEAIHDRPPGTFGGTFEDVLREVYPPDRDALAEAVEAALAGDGRYEIDYRIVRRDGSLGWLHASGQATFDDQRRPVRMAGICMDVTERRHADETTRLLAEAGSALGRSLDYRMTLEAVARLLVPSLADWCTIDLVTEGGGLERAAVVHSDPEKVELAQKLRSRYPARADAPHGVPLVIRTSEAALYPEISEKLLREFAEDEDHLRLMLELGLKSAIVVPLLASQRTLGAISLITAESNRRYSVRDLDIAEELASRCALAVENARLYDEGQRELAQRRVAEAAVRESEERLRFTLEAAHVGSWDWNLQTGEVQWSVGLAAIHALPSGSCGGRFEDMLQAIYAPDRERVQRAIDHALESGGPYDAQYRVLYEDGSIGWLHVQGRASFNEFERPERMAGICTDITQERRTSELTRLLAEAGAVLTGSLDYEATLDAVARLVVPSLGDWCAFDLVEEDGWLHQAAVIHSDPRKVELARELRRRYPPRLDALRGVAHVIRTGKPELYPVVSEALMEASAQDEEHLRMLRELGLRSGVIVPLTVRGRTLGAMTLVSAESERRYSRRDVGVIQELASRCALAVQNARLFAEAQHEIEERREAERRLDRAREAAEIASRSKSEFLANMSHEIRTPMTAILGYTDVLRLHLSDADDIHCVETIRRNGQFLLEIVGDILDLSRIEAGKLQVEKERFAPDELVAEIRSLMDVRAAERGLQLSVEYVGLLPESIESDPVRLRQILVNLIGNAIKFTDVGGVRVVVRLVEEGQESARDAKLEFRVVDTGIGISPEQQERLFEPFMQADSSVTRRFGGSGLGLSICRRLAEMLGGEISVQSDPRRGSTFTVTIATGSLEGVRRLEPRLDVTHSTRMSTAPPRLACRVLVVDDRSEVRHLVQHFLEEAGAMVFAAAHGRESLEVVDRAAATGEPVDIILLDMQMPVMDGYEAAARLRAGGFEGPIIALTAHAMKGDDRKCLDAGCDAYATKPIDRRSLIELVARYTQDVSAADLGRQRAPRSGARPRPFSTARNTKAADGAASRARRVLVVDDSADACHVLELLLGARGHDVFVAHDGRTAVEKAVRERPDAVLLDLTLPDMSGHDVARALRGHQETKDVLLIAVSGHDAPEDFERSRKAGFDHYLVKPAAIDELEKLLRSGRAAQSPGTR